MKTGEDLRELTRVELLSEFGDHPTLLQIVTLMELLGITPKPIYSTMTEAQAIHLLNLFVPEFRPCRRQSIEQALLWLYTMRKEGK